jgi:hypothetical protein
MLSERHPSSYRDPSGFIFLHEGRLLRQVNKRYQQHYEKLTTSGLYDQLVKEDILLPHRELDVNPVSNTEAWRTLEPEQLEFVSFPWEWSFPQLKDAALLTLSLMRKALAAGMILKDATPLNIQLHKGRLVFIDTLSFETYDATKPWIAYRQFCEGFLAPLALMHYLQQPLQPLMLAWPDGIPLPVAVSMLPRRSRWNLHFYLHLHLHARVGSKAAGKQQAKGTAFTQKKLEQILESLETGIRKLQLNYKGTWSAYYDEAATRDNYLERKQEVIAGWIASLEGVQSALDAGANDGFFSRLLAAKAVRTLSADSEHAAVARLYEELQPGDRTYPLLIDFANPSPAIGLNNQERSAFLQRGQSDLVLALAFIHHLAIGRNIPLDDIAALFAGLAQRLIIEFVPKSDEKVRFMLQQKEDIYDNYNEASFRSAFERHFTFENSCGLPGGRTLFLMTGKGRP